MNVKNTIKQWSKDDRPREKLITLGAESLSNSELLAILIHNGTTKKSALELAKEVLKLSHDNLNELGKLRIIDFQKISGIGEAKAVTIAAALEIGRRRAATAAILKEQISNSNEIAIYLKEKLKDYYKEVFAIVYLNKANKIIGFEIVSEGGITGTVADPKVILKMAIEKNAISLILCHNHPSGNLQPSKADELITQKIKNASALLDITVLDHIIVSDLGYFSFADQGLL